MLLYKRASAIEWERKRGKDPHRGSLQSRSCQPGISGMNRKLTIDCSLYTLEDRISILIHYKLGKKQKIQSLLVGLNTHTHQACVENEELNVKVKKVVNIIITLYEKGCLHIVFF